MLPRHSRAGGRPDRGGHTAARHLLAVPYLVAGLVLGIALSKVLVSQKCQPTDLDHRDLDTGIGSSLGTSAAAQQLGDQHQTVKRKRVLAFVGVQTGFTADPRPKYNYEARRAALRASWVPPTQAGLDRLEAEQGIVVRFVIGHSADAGKEAQVAAEEAEHGGFLRLPLTEGYAGLPTKTIMFLRAVTQQYDAQYIVKADDDVYLRLDRLPHTIQQWADIHADYVGCMKTGQIMKSPRYRWFEPQHVLLGGASYFTHAWGSIYVLSGRVAADLAAMRDGALRHFANEDVTIGSWLLAFNATHYDDRRLCERNCSASSLAVYDIPVCAGLCDPATQLPQLSASPACQTPATDPTGGLPLAQPLFLFDRQPDAAWEAGAVRQLREARVRAAQGIVPAHPEYDSVQPL